MPTTPPLVVATVRGVLGALATAGAAYVMVATQGGSNHLALLAAGGALCAYILARVGVEGIYDQGRAQ